MQYFFATARFKLLSFSEIELKIEFENSNWNLKNKNLSKDQKRNHLILWSLTIFLALNEKPERKILVQFTLNDIFSKSLKIVEASSHIFQVQALLDFECCDYAVIMFDDVAGYCFAK